MKWIVALVLATLANPTIAQTPAIVSAPQASTSAAAVPSTEDLQSAFAWCTRRYSKTEPGKKWVHDGQWKPGFENCEKIVSAMHTKQMEWNDLSQHKTKIDAIANGLK